MTLDFPNESRYFDPSSNFVHFWGYDGALEIPFYVDANLFSKLNPSEKALEADVLEAFDKTRDRIHEISRKKYKRGTRGSYVLRVADFD